MAEQAPTEEDEETMVKMYYCWEFQVGWVRSLQALAKERNYPWKAFVNEYYAIKKQKQKDPDFYFDKKWYDEDDSDSDFG